MIYLFLFLIFQSNFHADVGVIFQAYIEDKSSLNVLAENIDYLNANSEETIVELDSVFSLINRGSLYSAQIDKLMDLPFSKEIQNSVFHRLLDRNALNALALSKQSYSFPDSSLIIKIESKDSMTVNDWLIYLTLINNYNRNSPDTLKIIPKEMDPEFNRHNNIKDTIVDLLRGRKSGKILKDDLATYTIQYGEQWH